MADASAAHLFEVVREALVGVLGTAATATMFRRAAKRAVERRPDLALDGFQVVRDGMDYRWELPSSWHAPSPASLEAVGWLIREELCPVLSELTGTVVVDLLARQPEIEQSGILAKSGERA